MKKKYNILVLMAALPLMFASCSLFGDDTHITVEPEQLHGKWVKNASQEYWRYNSDGTGVTWDESEDVTEEESNLTYEWSINGDRLTHVFYGQQGNQAVPKVYTVTEIDGGTMKWKDDYGMSYQLNKVN